MQKTMPEFEALELYAGEKFDLPLPIAADVAERYLTGKLELSPRTATGFVRRYKQEKAGRDDRPGGRAHRRAPEREDPGPDRCARSPPPRPPRSASRSRWTGSKQLAETPARRRSAGAVRRPASRRASSTSIKVDGRAGRGRRPAPAAQRSSSRRSRPGCWRPTRCSRRSWTSTWPRTATRASWRTCSAPAGTPPRSRFRSRARPSPTSCSSRSRPRFVGDITVDGTPETGKARGDSGFDPEVQLPSGGTGRPATARRTPAVSGLKDDDGGGGSLSGGSAPTGVRQRHGRQRRAEHHARPDRRLRPDPGRTGRWSSPPRSSAHAQRRRGRDGERAVAAQPDAPGGADHRRAAPGSCARS